MKGAVGEVQPFGQADGNIGVTATEAATATPEQLPVPPLYWATFTKPWPLNDTISAARATLIGVDALIQIRFEPGIDHPVVIGELPSVAIFVICAAIDASTTWVMVEAVSQDAGMALHFSNAVRDDLVHQV